jgi:calcineurin-like phosphoesterase family protein
MTLTESLLPVKIHHDHANVFFWGCLHYGHRCESWDTPLWKMRGHNSSEEHDEAIDKALREETNEDSLLFLLGDSAFGMDAEKRLMSLLAKSRFKECYLMPGNHVSGWKQMLQKLPEGQNSFNIGAKKVHLVPNYLELVFGNQWVVLSHYPIVSFVKQGKGGIHLYSHVHGNLDKNPISKLYYNAPVLEVSVEKFSTPVSLKYAVSLLANKMGTSFDHHSSQTKD